jgi:flavin reductase (DIM6/NTAB) family NADH-FMN oxidoreductase RutF
MERTQTRAALRRMATNVAIVATRDQETLHGMTANAWSEGTEPPIVLVTLNRRSRTYECIRASGVFAASLLSVSQRELALRFARPAKSADMFADIPYRIEATGSPILEGCVAFFDCRVEGIHPFGEYDIVTGMAQACDAGESNEPLVFYDGKFARLAAPGEV